MPATWFALDQQDHWELRGADHRRFLHSYCSNNIEALRPGQGCEAWMTDINGHILAQLFVVARPESLWISTFPGNAPTITRHLAKYLLISAAELLPRTAESSEVWFTAADQSALPTIPPDFLTQSGDWLGQPTTRIVGPRPALADWTTQLTSAGSTPGTHQEWDAQRIAAGFPVFGRDISSEMLAQEAGRIPHTISFTKGCYLGQETIARIDSRGHVNHALVLVQGPTDPAAENAFHQFAHSAAAVSHAKTGEPLGTLTSAAIHDGTPYGIARLRWAATEPNTPLHLRSTTDPTATPTSATVVRRL